MGIFNTMLTSKSFFRRQDALVLYGSKSAGGFCINLPFPSSFSYIMSFEFVYLISPLGLPKLLVQFI